MRPEDALEWLREEAAAGRLADVPVEELPMVNRVRAMLRRNGILTAGQLVAADPIDIYRLPGCGIGALNKVKAMQLVLRTVAAEVAE